MVEFQPTIQYTRGGEERREGREGKERGAESGRREKGEGEGEGEGRGGKGEGEGGREEGLYLYH